MGSRSRRIGPEVGARKATEALLSRERFSGMVWDAHYNDVGIMTALCAADIPAFRTSLDFLAEVPPRYSTEMPNVITEPRPDCAEAYARRALEIVTAKIALLLPLGFLCTSTARQLFAETPLVRVYLLTEKPVHRKTPMVWLVWEKGSFDSPTMHII